MAKNAKKISALGFHPEDFQETRIPPVQESTHTHIPTQDDVHAHTHTSTHTDTQEQADTHTAVHTSTQEYTDAPVHTPAHKPTQKSTHTHRQATVYEPEQKKEHKTKRVQLLTYESLIQRMDAYAAKRGVTRVAVFEAALEAYLDIVDPKK